MNNPHDFNEPIALKRDCEAVLIPDGTPITLKEGTAVFVTQALGGSVTVNVNGNLARIPPAQRGCDRPRGRSDAGGVGRGRERRLR